MTEAFEDESHWIARQPQTIREDGLLWAVNTFVLWPLGLALATRQGGDVPDNVLLLELRDPETIVEGKIDVSKEPGGCHPRERFVHYAVGRVSAMPTEMEQEMALKRLRKLIPGIGIDPLES